MIYIDNETAYSQRIYIPRDEAPTSETTGHTYALQSKEYTITENGLINIHPDTGYDGISGGSIGVYVTAATGVTPAHLSVTENGRYIPTGDTMYTGVTVNVDTTAAYEQGYQDGYSSGYTVGYNEGYASGRTDGYQQGYASGSTDGFRSGYTSGYTDGYASGTTDGYNSGYTSGRTEGYQQGYASGATDGFNAGYASGMTDGYTSGYTAGYNVGFASGYTSGVTYQKSLLSSTAITRNGIWSNQDGWSSVTLSYPVYSAGFSDITENGTYSYSFFDMMGFEGAWGNIRFDVKVPLTGGTGVLDELLVTQNNTTYLPPQGVDGYSAVTVAIDTTPEYEAGYNAGVTHQKSLLSGETFTTNGLYTRANGISAITVNVDTASTYQAGYTSGVTHQKSLLATTAFTADGVYTRANGWSAVTVNVDSASTYQAGYASGFTDGYDSGYTSGYTSGGTHQKSLLSTTAITRNGSFTRSNGWSGVTVSVPLTTLSATTNGTYTASSGGYSAVTVNVQTTQTVVLTQAQYDALVVKDNNTIYLING